MSKRLFPDLLAMFTPGSWDCHGPSWWFELTVLASMVPSHPITKPAFKQYPQNGGGQNAVPLFSISLKKQLLVYIYIYMGIHIKYIYILYYTIIYPRAPSTFQEGVWGGFRGSSHTF